MCFCVKRYNYFYPIVELNNISVYYYYHLIRFLINVTTTVLTSYILVHQNNNL